MHGTPEYASPERLTGYCRDSISGRRNLCPASDIWSLGILLFEMCTGHVPFHVAEDGFSDLVRLVMACRYTVPDYVPREAAELIQTMLLLSPNDRATTAGMPTHHIARQWRRTGCWPFLVARGMAARWDASPACLATSACRPWPRPLRADRNLCRGTPHAPLRPLVAPPNSHRAARAARQPVMRRALRLVTSVTSVTSFTCAELCDSDFLRGAEAVARHGDETDELLICGACDLDGRDDERGLAKYRRRLKAAPWWRHVRRVLLLLFYSGCAATRARRFPSQISYKSHEVPCSTRGHDRASRHAGSV